MPIKFQRGDRERLIAFATEQVKPDPQLEQEVADAAEALTVHLEEATARHYGDDLAVLLRHHCMVSLQDQYTHALPESVTKEISRTIQDLKFSTYIQTTRSIPHHRTDGLERLDLDPAPFITYLQKRAKLFRETTEKTRAYITFIKSARNWDEVLAVWPAAGKVMDTGKRYPVPSPLTQSILDMIKADNAGA